MSDFVHLHTHTHYSLLGALPKIPDLVAAAKKDGMSALALTDLGSMYGAVEFYKECKDNNIKPVIGVDAYVAVRTRHDKQAGIDNKRHRILLYATTNDSYKRLMELISRAHTEGFYYKPRVDKDLLEEYKSELIATLPMSASAVADKLRMGDTQAAEHVIEEYKELFGNNLYLELTMQPGNETLEKLFREVRELAGTTKTKVVAGHDIYYLKPDDRKAWQTLMSVQSSGPSSRFDDDNDLSFISSKEMKKRFKDIPEALEATREIADACNVEIELGNAYFPHFPIPEDTTAEKELRELVEQGLKRRKLEKTEKVDKQIEYELDIINTKGYAPYFLVVADLLRHARENDIPTNIRGSVTGSIVTYLTGITNLNPFEYGLRFERFLNPDRPSLPDIDMDFADNRRDEIIEYAREKYGRDKVAQIGTFGTMMARGAVRDVARALGYPYALGDRIAKLIPMGSQGFPMTIDRAMSMEPELKEIYKNEPEVKEVIDLAQKIEGCARHISVHAAGVVIAPTTLTDFTPIQFDPKGGKLITQYDMYTIEEAGLPKFDFLGLKNLAILADTIKRIEWRHKKKIDLQEIPVDDPKTFELLTKGETMGLFQLNGSGMTHFLKELKPTNIHDINAMVALYRPGPMEFIPEYIKRKHNPELVDYPHELLKEDLEKSFGLLIYQEDVMMTAIKLAGYTWLEADKFRKAMGKKIPELMAEQEEKFKSGCVANGIEKELADDLWERIKPFAAYAFNKSHSASYGQVAYQTAYFKANYPVEYMAAILTADSGDVDKIAEAVNECERMGIPILPPDINESFGTFTIVDEYESTTAQRHASLSEVRESDEAQSEVHKTMQRASTGIADEEIRQDRVSESAIRFGLYTIKNFGEGISDAIIEERRANGTYQSLADFLERVHDRNLNKKSLESLIKCGALDTFGERGQMLANLDDLLQYNKEQRSNGSQDSLFGELQDTSVSRLTMRDVPPAPKDDCLAWEKELLGLYISGHPLDKFREKLESRTYNIEKIKSSLKEGMVAVAAGIIEDVRVIITKKGDKMAFVTIADFTGPLDVVVFPSVFENTEKELVKENCVAIKGKMSHRNGEISLIADNVKLL